MKERSLFNNEKGLYNFSYEHDACGVGMLVNIHGGKSHEIVESALKVLENMQHRGAEGADNKTGDGAGILLQIPHEFILLQGIPVPEKGKYGTGLLFLPKENKLQDVILSILIEEIEKEGLTLMHLRKVPVNSSILGTDALSTEPDIRQIFVTGCNDQALLEKKLYLIRKRVEKKIRQTKIFTSCRCLHVVSYIKVCCRPCNCDTISRTLPTVILQVVWRWYIRASVQIHSQPGVWRSLSVCWRTTARSTPSAETGDGWRHAKAC